MASQSHGGTARAILYAFIANSGIAIAKSWAAWITGSGSMLAEAIHSYADAGNQVLLYLGLRQSQRPPDEKHPLGYGMTSYFWSFLVALILFTMGGLFSIYEGVHKYLHPEPLSSVWIAVGVLVVAIVLEGGSLIGCIREIKLIRGDRPFREWFKHTRNAELVVVFGEDIAALAGLVIALGFILLAWFTGNPVYDAMGSICIGIILICISLFLTVRVRSLLVGRSADPDVQQAIDSVLKQDNDIEEVLNVITFQMGPDTMLAAKIRMKSGVTIDQAVKDINDLEKQLKTMVPGLKWCFIEPDNKD